MQFNLCMTQPIVEGHDDTVREGAYATTTKAFAVLNQKNTIRNRRVFSVGTVHDVWIYSHDAPWKQIRKGKRVFTANLGVEKTWSSRIRERTDSSRRGRFHKLCERCDRWYGNSIGPVVEPGDPFVGVGERGIEGNRTLRG